MNFQPLKNPCHCGRSDPRKMLTDLFPLHPESYIFSSADGFQHGQVTGIKKVEPAIRTILFFLRTADIIQFLSAAAVVIKGRNKLKITIVR